MQQFSDLAKEHFGMAVLNNVSKNTLHSLCDVENLTIICDDVRYQFEMDLLKEYDFTFIYIDAPEETRAFRLGELFKNPNHNSEISISELKDQCHLSIINNCKSVKEFWAKVVSVLCQL